MTTINRCLVLVFLALGINAFTQDFQGVATYKTRQGFNMKADLADSSDAGLKRHQKAMEYVRKQFERTYILSFDKEKSIYKEDISIDKPRFPNSKVINMAVSGSDILFKNTKKGTYTYQKDTFGKIFLIEDSLNQIDWSLKPESKYIGQYKCYKATYKKLLHTNKSKSDKKDEYQMITAWYTPEISVRDGPDIFHGLPGLILEISFGRKQIVCSKLTLNPEKRVPISKPKKGKKVAQLEYEAIIMKKQNEINELYGPRGTKKGDILEVPRG